MAKRQRRQSVSIPLKSGHIVTYKFREELVRSYNVSIPLKSGHIVTDVFLYQCNSWTSFNPLKVGSYCNKM